MAHQGQGLLRETAGPTEHAAVRSPAIEDYAKAIYALERRGADVVGTNALAERLGVTAASASGMAMRVEVLR